MKVSNYIAELIFRIDNKQNPPLSRFEKQIKLLAASNEKEAYQLALIAATKELDDHSDNDLYQWEFAGLGVLHPTEHPDAVVEGNSIIDNPVNEQEFLQFLRIRNASLQSKLAISA